MNARNIVPCGDCRLCCQQERIALLPEAGDDPSKYRSVPMPHPFTGQAGHRVETDEHGDCVYLGCNGCSIYDRAPAICRYYDCRRDFAITPRHERRRRAKDSPIIAARYAAGKARLHTLSQDDIDLARAGAGR